MPYVTQEARAKLDRGERPRTPGELTYLVYRAMLAPAHEAPLHEAVDAAVQGFLSTQGVLSYTTLSAVVGALECARREYQRRHFVSVLASGGVLHGMESYLTDFYWTTVAPYEDQKIAENGDVYV